MFQLTALLLKNADSSKWKHFAGICSSVETIICAPSRLFSHFARLLGALPGGWYKAELFAFSSAGCAGPPGWCGHPSSLGSPTLGWVASDHICSASSISWLCWFFKSTIPDGIFKCVWNISQVRKSSRQVHQCTKTLVASSTFRENTTDALLLLQEKTSIGSWLLIFRSGGIFSVFLVFFPVNTGLFFSLAWKKKYLMVCTKFHT